MSARYILLLFLGWLICLLTITYLGLSLLPNQEFYSKTLYYPNENLKYFPRWSNWDGGGYRYISEHGYIPRLTVFFPAYPLLIKTVSLTGLSSFWAALLVSSTATITALFFFFKLTLLDFKEKVAKRAIFWILIFPSSFYLIAVYSESLTLALAVSSFYFARKERWLLAAALAGMASVTRLSGIAVLFGIYFEYLFRDRKIINIKALLLDWPGRLFLYTLSSLIILNILSSFYNQNLVFSGILVSILEIIKWPFFVICSLNSFLFFKSLISKLDLRKLLSLNFLYLILASFLPILYLYYQYITFGSPFTFLQSEQSWGRVVSAPWQAILFNIRYILVSPLSVGEFSAHMHVQLLVFVLALTCLIISYFKLRLSYTLFFFIALLLPLFSGMLADITRYVLVIFPLFLVLSQIENELVLRITSLLSILMLGLLSILFFNNYFFI